MSIAIQSNLYNEIRAEYDEILRHKWLESEKAGHDIGLEQAVVDWNARHRNGWRHSRPRPKACREERCQ